MKVMIVYCHPSKDSFTHTILDSFLKGLESAGHSYQVSDLYEDGFDPVIDENEYRREAFYQDETPVKADVVEEQKKINASDMLVFIYPVFWTASPAMLEGWFQRVWTYGFAYGNAPSMKVLDKVLFLISMGGDLSEKIRKEQIKAMTTVMVGDRISGRAKACEVHVFDRTTRECGNERNRQTRIERFSKEIYEMAREL